MAVLRLAVLAMTGPACFLAPEGPEEGPPFPAERCMTVDVCLSREEIGLWLTLGWAVLKRHSKKNGEVVWLEDKSDVRRLAI